MGRFRTTGTCPKPPDGCGLVLTKSWETVTPDKVLSNVRVACSRCGAEFMATNEPIESKTPTENSKVEIVQDPLQLFVEFTVTTTHYEGDPLPAITKKPTGRVRRVGIKGKENWFTLTSREMDHLLNGI